MDFLIKYFFLPEFKATERDGSIFNFIVYGGLGTLFLLVVESFCFEISFFSKVFWSPLKVALYLGHFLATILCCSLVYRAKKIALSCFGVFFVSNIIISMFFIFSSFSKISAIIISLNIIFSYLIFQEFKLKTKSVLSQLDAKRWAQNFSCILNEHQSILHGFDVNGLVVLVDFDPIQMKRNESELTLTIESFSKKMDVKLVAFDRQSRLLSFKPASHQAEQIWLEFFEIFQDRGFA